MGIIEAVVFALAVIDAGINLRTVTAGVREAMSPQSVDDLFLHSLREAVYRHKKDLIQFTESGHVDAVDVDEEKARAVLERVDPTVLPGSGLASLARELAPEFVPTIRLLGPKGNTEGLLSAVESVLHDSLQRFVSEIPLMDDAIYKEVALREMERDAAERKTQGEFRQSVQVSQSANTAHLVRIYETVAALRLAQEQVQKDPYLSDGVQNNESEWPGFNNPFRRHKAEDFSDPTLFSQLFAVPERYDKIRGEDHLILEGGRGCGKSMILKSLQTPVALQIEKGRLGGVSDLTLEESGIDFFGVYIKLAEGCFDDAVPDGIISEEAARQFFQHYFNMELLSSVVGALAQAREAGLIAVRRDEEQRVCEAVVGKLRLESGASTLDDLQALAISEKDEIQNFLGFRRMDIPYTYNGTTSYVHDFPEFFCVALTTLIKSLLNRRIYILLDEFENLFEFQQTVVNTIVKRRPKALTLKVAMRVRGLKSRSALNGEPIQIPRDYHVESLDLDPESKGYRDLLYEISERRLRAEDFAVISIQDLLPREVPFVELGGAGKVEELVASHYEGRGFSWEDMTPKDRTDRIGKIATALVFRERPSSHEPRFYSGFETLASLSSGIVSSFLELCRTSLYFAEAEGINIKSGQPIPPEVQNRAVYNASRSRLDVIPRNIEVTGPKINRLIRNLADVFREKLLYHPTEPEAARIGITNPALLEFDKYDDLWDVIEDAVRWSVFHELGSAGYEGRRRSISKTDEFVLNRMLAPVLRISHRARWRTLFKVEELNGLLQSETVDSVKALLLSKHSGRDLPSGPSLFDDPATPGGTQSSDS